MDYCFVPDSNFMGYNGPVMDVNTPLTVTFYIQLSITSPTTMAHIWMK